MLPKELHQLKYEAISVSQDSVHLVKKTQERKRSTYYLLITKGVTSSNPVPLKTRRVGRILFSDEAHFWLNGYVNKQNCCIWSEANPQVYVETPLHSEKLTVWCALWAGGILLQKR
ncbi:uncharacterized protein TNCV_4623781 [Trichonephila clavipes]|nr:uncharacterized protein TNCV_4623781 [Trichonephila clavipes]